MFDVLDVLVVYQPGRGERDFDLEVGALVASGDNCGHEARKKTSLARFSTAYCAGPKL